MTDFHSLYQSYAPQVHRFVLFLCGDAALADDITSETFVRASQGFAVISPMFATVSPFFMDGTPQIYNTTPAAGARAS
jgi:Sigma-70 region 2